jgi:hypothetical protein
MAKFYVSSGSLNRIVSTGTKTTTAKDAAKSAILKDLLEGGRIDNYGGFTEVNETGFGMNVKDGLMFCTPRLLDEIGVL